MGKGVCRKSILRNLYGQIEKGKHLIGVSCGSGISAKYAVKGGADFLLALNSGRFRQAGLGTLAGYMPYLNCNRMVMDFGARELVPLISGTPIVFGLCATDPTIMLPDYIDTIRARGFSGINNYPTIGMIGGQFQSALEEEGLSYEKEVEAVCLARRKDFFSVAYVFRPEEARMMLMAGADVICAHLGLTRGGILGAKRVLSLAAGVKVANDIFAVCDSLRPDAIKMIYGGPVNSTVDVKYMYDNTSAHGYIGGSVFDRVPSEEQITSITHDFKMAGAQVDDLHMKMLAGVSRHYDYVTFVKEYIATHYMNDISFSDLASVAHVSRTHLSALFKKEVGSTFPAYLTSFRINKAIELARCSHISLSDVASLVGYHDYSHFSKAFKKLMGKSPREYLKEDTGKQESPGG